MFSRFKGMIFPHMAGSYDEAHDVFARKGIWMVEYLRARRSAVNYGLPEYRRKQERKTLGFYRGKHFTLREGE